MKKIKKKKKRSQAWKDLERYVAKFFNGQRILRGFNYSASLPDVVADGSIFKVSDINIVIECKHSKNQKFVDDLKDINNCIVAGKSEKSYYVFWRLEDTHNIISNLKNGTLQSKEIVDELPTYILDHYDQAKKYTLNALPNFNNDKTTIRLVVIAKKNSKHRIVYTSESEWITLKSLIFL